MDTYKRIARLRKERGFSQEYMASALNVSRPTYIQIEKGQRDLTIPEARKLASIFSLSLEDLIAKSTPLYPQISLEKEGPKEAENSVRIVMPRANEEKFKEVLLYVLSKVGAKPNIGETALYKLLYFIDFDFYERFEQQLTGARYM